MLLFVVVSFFFSMEKFKGCVVQSDRFASKRATSIRRGQQIERVPSLDKVHGQTSRSSNRKTCVIKTGSAQGMTASCQTEILYFGPFHSAI